MPSTSEHDQTYSFLAVVLGLYVVVTLIIFLIVNAVPESRRTEDLVNLEKRLIKLEHEVSSSNPGSIKSGAAGNDALEVRVALLEQRTVAAEQRVSERTTRIERKSNEIESSVQWQIAIIWGIIIALSAAVIPLRLGK
jgi:hypothetical protein